MEQRRSDAEAEAGREATARDDAHAGDPDPTADADPRLPTGPTFTRREFAAGAGAALLVPVAARLSPWRVGDGGRLPGRPAANGRLRAVARPDGSGPAGASGRPQEGEEEPAGTGALVDYVEARWGDRLSEDDREQIRSSVAGNLRAASAIDEVELENSDEPAFVFRPYRGEAP